MWSGGSSLYKCVPVDFLWMPIHLRKALGVITLWLFCWSFLAVPLIFLYTLLIIIYQSFSFLSLIVYIPILISLILPVREWPASRLVGQLWYEIFNFSCNLDPDILNQFVDDSMKEQFIIAMHPHGIIPIQAILWTAYCHQYLRNKTNGNFLYGFGAGADILLYLPFLRNISGWLSGGSATYKALKVGLINGISPPVNAAGRKPRNLYILPGGIAEVFTSTPGEHIIVVKSRKGLMKLSLETGAQLLPTYVFGGTDFFNNLATSDSWISKLSRKLRLGLTIFWGPYFLPIPYHPRVTMCIGKPIPVQKWSSQDPIPAKLIDELHATYIESIKTLFDQYKAVAGYPKAELKII